MYASSQLVGANDPLLQHRIATLNHEVERIAVQPSQYHHNRSLSDNRLNQLNSVRFNYYNHEPV